MWSGYKELYRQKAPSNPVDERINLYIFHLQKAGFS